MVDSHERSDPGALADRLARWRVRYAGRPLHRVSAGEAWLRLHLAGDDRVSVVFSLLPGANLNLIHHGPLPAPLHRALTPLKDHPATRLLAGARLDSCGALPGDRIACLRLTRPGAGPLYLLHQLFGSPGNLALLGEDAVLHWAQRRPPHPLLTAPPPVATWDQGDAETTAAAQDADRALATLANALVQRDAARTRAVLGRQEQSLSRLCANLSRDLATADQGEHFRRQAEALAAHLHEIAPGATELAVPDLRDGSPLNIELDPALPAAANLEAWFRKARKAEKGREVIATRLRRAEADAAEIAQHRERWDAWLNVATDDLAGALSRLAAVQSWHEENPDIAPRRERRGRRAAAPDEPARPFRRYLVDDRWEVWIGRNNRENDELTHRASHGRDIWLHAQGVPGSHVILRTGGKPEQVPRAVLEKAAALAAFNSKARHSGLVPVIHTERRYVRKPRKAPPGTAVTLRDKSLFVAPRLAPGVVAI